LRDTTTDNRGSNGLIWLAASKRRYRFGFSGRSTRRCATQPRAPLIARRRDWQ
jgi:hypothetical protein